ncbi:hypothetical protein FGG08_006461 [Glutinoglossum americanum]|uniref:Uncharacterized protein n=1 Tax=Glutinoglossum americanum TaxID=1670608 RepID=A0A9P8HW99_9PEZI|nr:hypothetical protein FGG08_006461 [Glutinoglossum americanum]
MHISAHNDASVEYNSLHRLTGGTAEASIVTYHSGRTADPKFEPQLRGTSADAAGAPDNLVFPGAVQRDGTVAPPNTPTYRSSHFSDWGSTTGRMTPTPTSSLSDFATVLSGRSVLGECDRSVEELITRNMEMELRGLLPMERFLKDE